MTKIRDIKADRTINTALEIEIDLDNKDDVAAIDSGFEVVRIVTTKGNKRVISWFEIGYYKGKPVMRVRVNQGGKETTKKIAARPWCVGNWR